MPPAQIFIDALGDTGAKLLLLVVIVAQLFCGMSSVTANSRMIYAFSRDGALPGSAFWHRVNPKTRTPTNAIWLAAGGALILGLPYLWNSTAYVAVTSIAVDRALRRVRACPRSCGCGSGPRFKARPVAPRPVVAADRDHRVRLGGLHLRAVHAAHRVARSPHTNFNYTVVAVVAVVGFAGICWLVSARKWFTGPKVQGSPEELAAIETELESLA